MMMMMMKGRLKKKNRSRSQQNTHAPSLCKTHALQINGPAVYQDAFEHAALAFVAPPPPRGALFAAFPLASRRFVFWRHCHSHSTGRKLHRSKSGHRTSRKTISVSWWHCQSMKSLRRSTPEVRIRRSRGGVPAVNMWLERVWVVIFSGSGYVGWTEAGVGEELREGFPGGCEVLGTLYAGGESGCRVVDEAEEGASYASLSEFVALDAEGE